ncbi:hypothetical protein [Alteromonas sp. P256]|uniref:hypothetical protein n=1 Tax=Alteromonas sp. P256 TaxID=3117399 RepID=UPI002FE172ED
MTSESYISLAAFSTTLLGKGVFTHRPMKSNLADASVNGQSKSGADKRFSLTQLQPSGTTSCAVALLMQLSLWAVCLLPVRKNIALIGVTFSEIQRRFFSKTNPFLLSITSGALRSLEQRG